MLKMKLVFHTLIFMLVSVIHLAICEEDKLKVTIPALGQLMGSEMSSASGRKFQAFRGIPFAEPPVGDLRFKDPVPAKSWGNKVLDVTKEGPVCIQHGITFGIIAGVEDCLALNVYTPSKNYNEDSLPVMVWIHGGGWVTGSGNGESDVYGPDYLLDRDIVLVTINYRLGPMGFLSTEDAEAPGNYGLLDQSMALKWVQDHIKHFGGNPGSVTIFGESAGGASVEFQILSPHSKGLFHRAIAQSGSTRCPWSLQYDVGEYTNQIAEQLKCPTSSSQELVNCLRGKDAREIVETRLEYVKGFGVGLFPIGFGPRIDAERDFPFLPDDPARLISQKMFNAVPIIAGVTKDEGGLFGASLASVVGKDLEEFNKDPIDSVQYIIGMEKRKNGREIAEKVYDHYFVKNKNKETHQQFSELESDYGFFKCVDESVDLLSYYNDNGVYYYHYAHKSPISFVSYFNAPPGIDFGVVHADDLFMLFNSKMTPPLTPDDTKASKILIDLWTSFATDGMPKSEHLSDSWLPIKNGQTRYLNFNANNPTLVEGPMPFQANLAFWNRLSNPAYSVKSEL